MGHEIEPRTITASEVIAEMKANAIMRGADPSKIEIHYHAGPPAAPPAPPAADPMAPAARLAPYFLILLGGAIILAIIAVITLLLVPVLMTFATMIAIMMGSFAVCMIAVAASVRSLRYSKYDAKRHE